MKTEYVVWGVGDKGEQVIRVNGQETHSSLKRANTIKRILGQRGEFHSIRIQKINMNNFSLAKEFRGALIK